jgi:hypothetical protein
MSRIDYTCARCNKRIPYTAIIPKVRPDYKLAFEFHCHGEVETVVVAYDMGGVLFSVPPAGSARTRRL